LNSINKKDFIIAKSFSSPPAGVPEVFAACMWLLSGFYPEGIEIDGNKRPRHSDWKGCQRMMKNPDEFLQKLQAFKDVVDQNLVQAFNVATVKQQFLKLPSFSPQIMANKSAAARGICEWVINIVKYYDVIQQIEPKRLQLRQSA